MVVMGNGVGGTEEEGGGGRWEEEEAAWRRHDSVLKTRPIRLRLDKNP